MCRRCEKMCNEVQTVGVLSGINRGFEAVVAPAFERNLDHSECTYCGQCVAVCPTAALPEVDHTNQVLRALADPDKNCRSTDCSGGKSCTWRGVRNGAWYTGYRQDGCCTCVNLNLTMYLIQILPPTLP
jgi:NADH dehydrogenase/NADH:ubiquinone oxidoreductase subunit G